MSDRTFAGSAAQDEDRLPWLEPVDDEDAPEGIAPMRLLLGLLVALTIVGAAAGGIFWFKARSDLSGGDGQLIKAPPGDYKVPPDHPGGMQVEGTGDVAYNVSEGGEAAGSINLDNQPEAPVQIAAEQHPAATDKPSPAPAHKVTASVAAGSKLPSPRPRSVTAASGAAGANLGATSTGTIQLGAFSTSEAADKAWNSLARRHPPLKDMTKDVVPATVNGGTVYRLRAHAGEGAAATCTALRAVGASCNLVN
jgi:hypothetical protein